MSPLSTHISWIGVLWRMFYIFHGVHCYTTNRMTNSVFNLGRKFSQGTAVQVALTRERGNNDDVERMLRARLAHGHFEIHELPCIRFTAGPDADRLPKELLSHDTVVLTSPRVCLYLNITRVCPYSKTVIHAYKLQAANVVLSALKDGTIRPHLKVTVFSLNFR